MTRAYTRTSALHDLTVQVEKDPPLTWLLQRPAGGGEVGGGGGDAGRAAAAAAGGGVQRRASIHGALDTAPMLSP